MSFGSGIRKDLFRIPDPGVKKSPDAEHQIMPQIWIRIQFWIDPELFTVYLDYMAFFREKFTYISYMLELWR
jgi:hypothetical protein